MECDESDCSVRTVLASSRATVLGGPLRWQLYCPRCGWASELMASSGAALSQILLHPQKETVTT